METTNTTPFWSGRSSFLQWFINGEVEALHVVSWNIKQVVQKGLDHVNGERRARPWVVVDGYEINVKCRQRDAATVRYLTDLAMSRIGGGSLRSQFAISLVVKPLDGSSHGFITVGSVALGGWDFGVDLNPESLSNRNYLNLTFHTEDIRFVTE